MKPIKILLVIVILSFAVSILNSQETAGENTTSAKTDELDTSISEGPAGDSVKEAVTVKAESDKVKTTEKRASEKNVRVEPSKKTLQKEQIVKSEPEENLNSSEDNSSGSDFLLSISEGDFKYRRIPDIKLAEKSTSGVQQNQQDMNAESDPALNSDTATESGLFGLSSKATEIVAKGGILLLILLIFILYKVRSRSTVRRSSGRNVMNSYRK